MTFVGFLIMVPGIDPSRADASDDATQEPSKNFLSNFLTNRNSESRSTQNFNFNLFSIKSKPTSRYEPVSQFKGLPSAHFINRYRILAHISIKVKLPSTSINASGLRSTQNLNYNSQLIKSKVGILRTFSSTTYLNQPKS